MNKRLEKKSARTIGRTQETKLPVQAKSDNKLNDSSTNDMQEIKVRITSRHNKVNREVPAPTKALTRNMSNLIQIKRTPLDCRTAFSKQLSVRSLNPGSVKNKTHLLSDFITTHKFDILATTEAWVYKCTDKQIIN